MSHRRKRKRRKQLEQLTDRLNQLERLIVHCWVHSGYRDCGRSQMTTEQRMLYDAAVKQHTGYDRASDPELRTNPGYT